MSEILELDDENLDNEKKDDDELRALIYERLGLEFGSLKSESGNDWVRAKAEIEAEISARLNAKLNKETPKDEQGENEILEKIKNEILDENYKSELIKSGKKDILIAIARHQDLSDLDFENMLLNAPYLCVKELSKKSNLTPQMINLLFKKTAKQPRLYADIIKALKDIK